MNLRRFGCLLVKMKLLKVEKHPEQELFDRLKKVSLLNNTNFYPYKNCYISLEKIKTDYLTPVQNYIWTESLKKVRLLKWALEEHGIDIYNLNGYVTLYLEGEREPVDLLPPIIEESIERDGSVVNLVCDGMHRVYMARLDWIVPQVVFIRGIPKECPYYACPVPNGWDGVKVYEQVPDEFLKKWHRVKEHRNLYRNFNSAFQNVGAPRTSKARG